MIKQFFKKVLIIYLVVIACIFTPTYKAYAVSAGGWAFSSFDVAKNLVTAMKNGASASVAVAKSPITSKIAKGILGGAIAGAAIPLAISQLTFLSRLCGGEDRYSVNHVLRCISKPPMWR